MARRARLAGVMAVAAFGLLALTCAEPGPPPAHPSAAARSDEDDACVVYTPTPPPAHRCPDVDPNSPLHWLNPRGRTIAGCPADVRLRPGTYGGYAVAFACSDAPTPTIVIRGLGTTPYPVTLASSANYDHETVQLHRLHDAVPGVLYLHYFGTGGRSRARRPCATHAAGVVMEIFDYHQVDPTVERIVRFLLHNDLDTEVLLEIRSIPSEMEPPELDKMMVLDKSAAGPTDAGAGGDD